MSLSLEDLSRKMKEIDFAMLATHAADGALGSRPMRKRGASIARCAGIPPSITLRITS